MTLYTRSEEPSSELVMVTKYIVQVYAPVAAKLIHMQIKLVRVREIVLKNLQGNSYCALQENYIYCLLNSK